MPNTVPSPHATASAPLRMPSRLPTGSALDSSFVGVSAPHFVVGILMLYIFAVQLGWFPIGGYGTFQHLVLPSLTQSVGFWRMATG